MRESFLPQLATIPETGGKIRRMQRISRRRLLAACAGAWIVAPEADGWLVRRARRFSVAWWPTSLFERFYEPLQARVSPASLERAPRDAHERLVRDLLAAERDPAAALRIYRQRIPPVGPFLTAATGRAFLQAADAMVVGDVPRRDVTACVRTLAASRAVRYRRLCRGALRCFERIAWDPEARRLATELRSYGVGGAWI